MTLTEIIEQLRSCNYECEAGRLENNVAWRELEKMAAPDSSRALVTTEYGHRFIVGPGEIVCVPWGDKIMHITKVETEPVMYESRFHRLLDRVRKQSDVMDMTPMQDERVNKALGFRPTA